MNEDKRLFNPEGRATARPKFGMPEKIFLAL